MRNYLFIALTLGLTLLAFNAFQSAKPTPKSAIYQSIKPYSPYYIEKRFGGLQIRSKLDENFKEKPSNMEIFHRLESLEKEWGKEHLRIQDNTLTILDQNNTTQTTLPISTAKDRQFLHQYYGI